MLDSALISTGVDELIALVKDKGRVEINMASKLLHIPVHKIEEWAKVLEDAGILGIEYKMAHVFLVWRQPSKEEVERDVKEWKEKKQETVEELSVIQRKVGEAQEELERLSSDVLPALERVEQRLTQIERTINERRAEEKGERERLMFIEDELRKVESSVNSIRQRLANYVNRIDELEKRLSEGGVDERAVRISERVDEVKGLVEQLEQGINKAENLIEKLKALNAFDVSALKNELDEYSDVLSGFKEVKDVVARIAKEVEDVKARLAEVEKKPSKEAVEALKERVKRIEQALDGVENVIVAFPPLNKLEQAVVSLRERLEVLEAKTVDINEVDELIEELMELRDKAVHERELLLEESGTVFSTIKKQMETFKDYANIREKMLASMKSVRAELKELGKQLNVITEQLSALKDKESAIKPSFTDIDEVLNSVKEKKAVVAEIRERLNFLRKEAKDLSKKISTLAKEAEIIKLRMPSESDERLVKDITLTKERVQEFEKKRQELKALIEKLWSS